MGGEQHRISGIALTGAGRVPALLAVCIALWPGMPGAAQGSSLFETEGELAVVLELPLSQLLRSTIKRKEFAATLSYTDAGGRQAALPLAVRVRGKKRVEVCKLPPLRLDFKRKDVAGSLFDSQAELKLVTQCKHADRYRDYLLLEQKIYQAYALLTPLSFRTRLLSVSYRNSNAGGSSFTEPALLIEDVGQAAVRLGMQRLRQPRIEPSTLDAGRQNLLEMFQFMIGNTDWSSALPSRGDKECCHNGKVLGSLPADGRVVILPYDFDHAGLIDADYALASPGLHTGSVTERVYRGRCAHNDRVAASIERLQQLRPAIEQLFEDERLGSDAARRALGYLRSFYALVASEERVKRQIFDACVVS